ncbi:MAG: folylpolyglutamate synthase/dihydrofolate synthase family protein [Pseudoxanthomonas suwonensis]|nr:folylpolyglutamate synthase/dihydrofolate synthase family protein [Pseudoxanthomonas suwonensis]
MPSPVPATLEDWLLEIEQRHPRDIELGLDRIRSVHARMRLTRPAPQVITVAGTNGKGSTVAFIESIARAAGWRVGSYTSPHLLRYNERVRIDGEDVDDASLVAAFQAVEDARGDVPLTYFETGTLAALWLFANAAPDLAVLEVGLGGRLDAVNIVDADVAVITTVDLDHQDWLGGDIEAIGREKAGIARPWKPLVLGDDDPPASVLRHAYAIGAPSWRIANDFFAEPVDASHWRWRDVGFEAVLPRPRLAAPVQLRNAACAIAALRALPDAPPASAYGPGLLAARAAARLQRWERDGVEWWVDVGHNPQAARALAQALDEAPPMPTHAIYSALADKDVTAVVAALAARVEHWHLAGSEAAGPRGQAVEALAARLRDGPAGTAHLHPGLANAIADVDARPGQRVLVFGSFHAAGEALRLLNAGS